MKIVHLTNNLFDGAGRAVYQLHLSLKNDGLDSKVLVYRKKDNDPDVVQVCDGHPIDSLFDIFRYHFKFVWFVYRKLTWYLKSKFFKNRTIFNFLVPFVSSKELIKHIGDADVICLYSVQSFLTPKLIKKVYEYYQKPIVWTLLDVEPLTGGCHFNFGCDHFENQCGQCPQLENNSDKDQSFKNWLEKKNALSGLPIHFIVANKWVEGYLDRSSLFSSHQRSKIALGLNNSIFKPGSKENAKEQLGISKDKKVVLFGCLNLLDQRKGGQYLYEALKSLSDDMQINKEDVVLVTFGGSSQESFSDLKFEKKDLGFISDDACLARAYQAADVFVSPSVDDLGPRVVTEAYMCKTPVVSFNIGMALDLVVHKKDGYLADYKSAKDLANGIKYILSKSRDDETGFNLIETCSSIYQQKQYQKLFKQLCQ